MGEPGRAVVRVHAPAGFVAGAGLLVARDVVATCAHVVSDALGLDDVPDETPARPVAIDLPFAPGRPGAAATVWRWSPPRADGGGDVALLRIAAPPDHHPLPGGVVPTLRRVDDLWDRRFQAAGFPPGREEGRWVAGTSRRAQGGGWVQLDGDGGPDGIGPGFSGTGIWDAAGNVVVALAVAADRAVVPGTGSAYALPIDRVLGLAPELLTNPYRGLAAFGEADEEFFFGRAGDVGRCLDVLVREGLVVLAGGSGSGKSSLLAAGLVPALRRLGRRIAPVRLAGVGTPDAVTDAVLDALTAAAPAAEGAWRTLFDTLFDAPLDPREAPAHLAVPAGVVVVIDQLEDLAGAEPAAARRAVELVTGLAAHGVGAAVTSRWATFDDLAGGPALGALHRATVAVSPLDRAGLRAAVAEPAARVPGPAFAPGVVERIVDDAGDEPGRLPLVATLLAELWDAPDDDGLLTLEAYRRVGAVEGAVVTAAERTWAALDPAEQDGARAALTAMTRPTDTGFARRAVPLHRFGPDRRAVVRRLAAARLVVVARGPGDDGAAEVAEPAHQALLERWPRLRGWLADDADFLRWRAGVVAASRRWRPTRDPGTLLRGTALETAIEHARTRGDDLDPEEREFIAAGGRRRRRERRIRTTAVAVVVVLALVAGVLSAVLARSNGELTTALDTANARTLSELSGARLATDPQAAVQFALAAYGADPDDARARSALGQAALVRRSTVGTLALPGVTAPLRGIAVDVDPTADATLVGTSQGAVLVDGLRGPTPRVEPVPGVDTLVRPIGVAGRGRFVLMSDAAGAVRVWDRQGSAPPRPLPGLRTDLETTADGSLFSTVATAGGTVVVTDDLVAGTTTPVAALPEPRAAAVPTADPGRLLVRVPDPPGPALDAPDFLSRPPAATLSLRDARSGAVLRTFPPDTAVADGGRLTVGCVTDSAAIGMTIVVSDAATGDVVARVPTRGAGPSCRSASTMITADQGHLAWLDGTSSRSDVQKVGLVDLTTGARSSLWIPGAAALDSDDPRSPERGEQSRMRPRGTSLLAVQGDRALLADGPDVDVLAPSPAPRWRDDPALGRSYAALGADRSYAVLGRDDGGLIHTVDPATGAEIARLTPDRLGLAPGESLVNSGTYDGVDELWVQTDGPGGPRVREYALPGLSPTGVYDLGSAGAGGLRSSTLTTSTVVTRTADRLVVLSGGVLSWWSPTSHRPLGPPVVITTDPAAADGLVEDGNGLAPLDPAGDTVAFQDPGGVAVWTLGVPRPVHVDVDLGVSTSPVRAWGGRLATLDRSGRVDRWDPRTGAPSGPSFAVPAGSALLGTDPTGDLVTADTGDSSWATLDFRTPDGGDRGEIVVPDSPAPAGPVVAGRWDVDATDDLVSVPVSAPAWRAQLCAVQDRAFTAEETAQLPVGADTGPPCSREG